MLSEMLVEDSSLWPLLSIRLLVLWCMHFEDWAPGVFPEVQVSVPANQNYEGIGFCFQFYQTENARYS